MLARTWCMPSGDTFSMPPVAALLARLDLGGCIVDPFARNSKIAHLTNDLNPEMTTQYHMDAQAFAEMLKWDGVVATAVLFDPPYSHRQCRELYDSVGIEWTKEHQQQIGRWAKLKDTLNEILRPGGIAVSFGWNSTGFGKSRGFDPVEHLLLNHGSAHNDTIVTVERKR